MADPRVEQLRRVPLFSFCDGGHLSYIATQVDELDFPAGKVLCQQGAPGGDFFILLSGSAEVARDGRHVRDLRPGDFFGEIALLERVPRTATVTTTSASRCLVLGQQQFQNVLAQRAEIALAVLHAMADRLRALHQPPAD